jgi:hypothetical protein
MSRKKITEEFLAREVWWWRAGASKHPIDFNPKVVLSFNYELARRIKRGRRLAPFTDLKANHFWIISPFLGETSWPQIESRHAGNEQQENEKGWTQIRPKLQWNLNLSERRLVRAFQAFIRHDRERQGIPASQPLPKRKRPFSWTWLELMDLADFKVRPLKDNERSSLSSARKAARKQAALFDKAIDDYWEMDQENEAWDEADPAFDDWLQTSKSVKTPTELWRHIWPKELGKR